MATETIDQYPPLDVASPQGSNRIEPTVVVDRVSLSMEAS